MKSCQTDTISHDVQIDEDPKERKKTSWRNFKNAVYHEAFRQFLKDVALFSKVGCEVLCGDRVSRLLFPFIHIISADYEEQWVIPNVDLLESLLIYLGVDSPLTED